MKALHFMLGDGVRCDYGWEAPNACDDWARVTCRNCLRLHRYTLRRNIRGLEERLENGLPPGLVGRPRWTREAMLRRLGEYRETLTIVDERLTSARR